MKRIVFTSIILMCLLLCSCAKGKDMVINVSPNNKSIIDLSSKRYSEECLRTIVEIKDTMFELNTEYPIECIREQDGYRVSYLGEQIVAVI